MTMRDPKDGLKGLEALQELGTRLEDLFGTVKTVLEEAAEKTGDAERKDGGKEEVFTMDTPFGKVQASMGMNVRPLGGLSARSRPARTSTAPDAEYKKKKTRSTPREQFEETVSSGVKSDVKSAGKAKAGSDITPSGEVLDILEEDDHVLVLIEFSGLSGEPKLSASLEDEKLSIQIGDEGVRIEVDAKLPTGISVSDEPDQAFRNGILELKFKKSAVQ